MLPEHNSYDTQARETTLHTDTCPNCGAELTGKFCSNCGQKKIDKHDYSFGHFIGHAIGEFTHFDSKFFKTFYYLFTKPGRLTKDYLDGRRSQYMQPLQLFIIANLFFFIIGHYEKVSDIFTTPLKVHEEKAFYHTFAADMIAHHLQQTHESHEAYKERFDHTITTQAKSLVIIMVPVFSLFVYALYFKARRFYMQHFIYVLHVYAFILLSVITLLPLLVQIPAQIFNMHGMEDREAMLSLSFCLVLFTYMFLSSRVVYQQRPYITFIKSALMIPLFIVTLNIYHFILFLTAFCTV